MELNELFLARRSVRCYQANGIPTREEIEEILSAAGMAPSWKNSQTARCYVVLTDDMIKALSTALPAFNQSSSMNAAYIVTTFVKDTSGFTAGSPDNEVGNGWGAYDLGLHNAYLLLKAKDMGYDTLIMGLRDEQLLRRLLNIPKSEAVMSVIAIGRGCGDSVLKPRKSLNETAVIL